MKIIFRQPLLGTAVTVLLLWWVLRGEDFGEIWTTIRQGNFLLLTAAVAVATFGFFIRALRWKILLTPVRPDTKLRSRFAAVSIGFMANNLLPARVGEFARAYAFSRLDGGMGPGPWRVIAGVHPTNVRRTVESIRQEIRRMRDEPVPAEELEDNKAYITGSLPLRLETNEGVAGALIEMERYKLGLDYLRRYPDLIRAITAEEIQQVVRRWLDPDAFALGIAGPPEEAS